MMLIKQVNKTRFFIKPFFAFIAISFLTLSSLAHAATNKVDSLTKQWLDIERQQRELDTQWRQQKPALKQRIQLLNAEKKQLETILTQNNATQDDVEQKRETLLAAQSDLETQQDNMDQLLSSLQAQVDELYSTLPPPVQQQWDDEQAQLNAAPSNSERLQVMLAKLGNLQRFNEKLLVKESLMTSDDEQNIVVKQLFLGSSYAWFSSADEQYTGIGKVVDGQWQWQFDSNLDGEAISRAIAIFEKKHEPEYVRLPVQLGLTKELTNAVN